MCLSNASRKKLLAQAFEPQTRDIDAPLAALVRACTYENPPRARALQRAIGGHRAVRTSERFCTPTSENGQ